MHHPLRSFLVASTALCLCVPSASSASSAPSAPSPTKLRVASYNAWLLPLVATDVNRRRRAMPSAIAAHRPDVLCLQEVWLQGHQRGFAKALKKRLPHAAFGQGGLAILSRFPIGRAAFYPFPADADLPLTERFAGKGYFEVDIGTPAGPIRVVNSHMVLDFSPKRAAHARQVASLLAGVGPAAAKHATIVCADLNMRSFLPNGDPHPELKRFLDVGFAVANTHPREPTRIGWPRPRVIRRAWSPDFVMLRAGTAVAGRLTAFRRALHTLKTALSDHDLVLVDIALSPRP